MAASMQWDWRLRRRSCGCLCRDGVASAVEIDELALKAELGEVAAGRLDPPGVGDAARLERVEAGSANQTLDRRRSGVVVGSVEEHGPPWFAVCASGERVGAERAKCLHVVRAGGKQGRDNRAG